MLGKIRDHAGSWFFKIFLTLIALSFVLWGVSEFATGSFNSTAITINDTKIAAQDVGNAYRVALRNTESRFGTELSDAHKQQLRIGESTIGSIIRETLLTDYAKQTGIRISNEQLNSVLRGMKNFQNTDGEFDKDIYRNSLRNQNDMTVDGFEKLVKGQLSRIVLNTVFDTPFFNDTTALNRIAKANKEEIAINVLTITKNGIKNIKTPTAQAQRDFYNTSLERWQTSELRTFNVLNISAEQMAKNIIITDNQASDFYKSNMNDYNVPNKRQAQHILVSTERKAKEVLAKVKKGESFSKLAKKYSTDKFSAKKGGDIGKFASSDMVKEFADVAFSLKIGEISDIVKTPFGFHIIKLTNTFPSYLQTFEEVKQEIKKNIAAEKAEKLYADILETVEDSIAAGDDLKKISTDLNLPINNYKNKTRWDGLVDSSMLAPVDSTATRTAFTLPQGEISDKIDLADTNSIYVQISNIIQPKQKSFEEVKSDVLATMLNTAKLKALSKKAIQIYKDNKNGKSLKSIAKTENITQKYKTIKGITKQLKSAPKWFNSKMATTLFDYPNAKYLASPVYKDTKYYIVELAKRSTPKITKQNVNEEKSRIAVSIGNDLRLQYIKYLYENADVSFNLPLLRQVMPGEPIDEQRISN